MIRVMFTYVNIAVYRVFHRILACGTAPAGS